MKLSYEQLKAAVASYVDGSKIDVSSFSATYANTVGLLDTIAKIFTLESKYVDKLAIFDAEQLEFGKTVEEWAADLILPESYDSDGTGALSNHSSTFRPVSFSFTLGRKQIPQTIKNNDIERAVHNAEQFSSIISAKTKAMYDSETVLRYQIKREALSVLIARCEAAMDASSATVFSVATAYSTVGGIYKKSGGTSTYVLVKPYAANAEASFEAAVSSGYLIKYELVSEIAAPVDTATGEAFVKQVKKDVEIASDLSEGHSLSGNTLGSTEGLVLLVKQGVMPEIEVEVMAGAFHEGRVALPAEVITVKDFGSNASGAYAILMDRRGVKLFNSYRAVRENLNGSGDWLNMFFHTENTVHISNNVFVKVYKPAA